MKGLDLENEGFEILRDKKYKGKIYIYDSERDSFMMALKALGYSSSEIKSVTKDFKINDYPDLGSAVKAALKMLTK